MSHATDDRISSFILEGQFLGFVLQGSKLKYLRVAVPDGELQIKLSKEARATCRITLEARDLIQVFGQAKRDRDTGELKLKAIQIRRFEDRDEQATAKIQHPDLPTWETSGLPQPHLADASPITSLVGEAAKPNLKLLVCQKSSCQKKGGSRQQQALKAILRDRNLHNHITIQETGCLGKCSMAPNIVLMPGKKRLSGMKPDAIVELLETLHSR